MSERYTDYVDGQKRDIAIAMGMDVDPIYGEVSFDDIKAHAARMRAELKKWVDRWADEVGMSGYPRSQGIDGEYDAVYKDFKLGS